MNDLNSVLLEGRMTADPTYKTTPKGTPLCTFSIAVSRSYKNGEAYEKETSFFDVETWAKTADMCNTLGKKGRGLRAVGRMKQDRWEQDGKQRSRIFIVADHVEFRPEFKKDAAAHGQAAAESQADDIPF